MIEAVFQDGQRALTVYGLDLYDKGQDLQIKGLQLPKTIQVHFSNQEQ